MRNLLVFIIILCSCLVGVANDIRISNMVLSGQDTVANTISVRFDIQWENSWRTNSGPGNWDAAWVFVKYRLQGSSTWHHAYLAGQGHTPGSGVELELGLKNPASPFNQSNNPALGTFIYRSTEGDGLFSAAGVTLKWDYGANGLPDNAGEVEIKVFGIEMVLVPSGNFYLGSGGTETNRFHSGGNANGAFLVTGEQEIGIGTGSGQLYYTSDNEYAGDRQGPVPTAFPKGFKGFYAMKYEISQQQYADFLNTLNARQLDIRLNQQDFDTNSGSAFELQRTDTGFVAQRPYSACNFISVYDALAYSDWAGLRPMSEMEFEKAARGSLAPVPNEYAWGDTTLARQIYNSSNFGKVNEQITSNYQTQSGNAAYSTTTPDAARAPYRVGVFAGNPQNSGRRTAGSGYWGLMEQSGNLYEYCVTAGSPAGRQFTGQHGDGSLDSLGNHNESDWAGDASMKYSLRGGAWSYTPGAMRTSDREFGGRLFFAPNLKRANRGYRGVRTAGLLNASSGLPQLGAVDLDFVTFSTAVLSSSVVSDQGDSVVQRGIVWGKSPVPLLPADSLVSKGSGSGAFSISIQQLEKGETYFARAYARNGNGAAYGPTLSFRTLDCGDVDSNRIEFTLLGVDSLVPMSYNPLLYVNDYNIYDSLYFNLNQSSYRIDSQYQEIINPKDSFAISLFGIDSFGCKVVSPTLKYGVKQTQAITNCIPSLKIDVSQFELNALSSKELKSNVSPAGFNISVDITNMYDVILLFNGNPDSNKVVGLSFLTEILDTIYITEETSALGLVQYYLFLAKNILKSTPELYSVIGSDSLFFKLSDDIISELQKNEGFDVFSESQMVIISALVEKYFGQQILSQNQDFPRPAPFLKANINSIDFDPAGVRIGYAAQGFYKGIPLFMPIMFAGTEQFLNESTFGLLLKLFPRFRKALNIRANNQIGQMYGFSDQDKLDEFQIYLSNGNVGIESYQEFSELALDYNKLYILYGIFRLIPTSLLLEILPISDRCSLDILNNSIEEISKTISLVMTSEISDIPVATLDLVQTFGNSLSDILKSCASIRTKPWIRISLAVFDFLYKAKDAYELARYLGEYYTSDYLLVYDFSKFNSKLYGKQFLQSNHDKELSLNSDFLAVPKPFLQIKEFDFHGKYLYENRVRNFNTNPPFLSRMTYNEPIRAKLSLDQLTEKIGLFGTFYSEKSFLTPVLGRTNPSTELDWKLSNEFLSGFSYLEASLFSNGQPIPLEAYNVNMELISDNIKGKGIYEWKVYTSGVMMRKWGERLLEGCSGDIIEGINVEVLNSNRNGVPNIPITFEVVSGGGKILDINGGEESDKKVIVTDDDGSGRAGVDWKLGPSGEQRLEAKLFDANGELIESILFEAELLTKILSKVPGSPSTGRANSLLSPFSVSYMPENGIPLKDFPVTFEVLSGGGNLGGGLIKKEVRTNASGEASTDWVIGQSGIQELRASLVDENGNPVTEKSCSKPVTFVVHLSEVLSKVPGAPSSGRANSLLGPFAVSVETGDGIPVEDFPVTFEVLRGGGKIGGEMIKKEVRTNSSGVASTDWLIGQMGTQELRASLVDENGNTVTSVAFVVLIPKFLSKVPGSPSSGRANSTLSPFIVSVKSEEGTPIEDFPVTFEVLSGGGSLGGGKIKKEVRTNSNGEANTEWMIGEVGTQELIASLIDENGNPSASVTFVVSPGFCGALIAPTVWKEFMCHNLGVANPDADPFTPSWEINGGYWQWGRKTMGANGPTGPDVIQSNSSIVSGWTNSSGPIGSWRDSIKTNNDPCPEGFRIPTRADWKGVADNNNAKSVGSSWSASNVNYTSGRLIGENLFLPAAGTRLASSGNLSNRGLRGGYWSSDVVIGTSNAYGYFFDSSGDSGFETGAIRASGQSVRCIKEIKE